MRRWTGVECSKGTSEASFPENMMSYLDALGVIGIRFGRIEPLVISN